MIKLHVEGDIPLCKGESALAALIKVLGKLGLKVSLVSEKGKAAPKKKAVKKRK